MKRLFLSILILLLACACACAESYTVSLTKGEPIHSGPGSDYELLETLDESGVFTIVEEGFGLEGELWGKLKSGAGWVQLTDISSYTTALPAGTAIHAGPGHAFKVNRNLGESGVFTIVLEKTDENGDLWGRLKSGAGWVYLTGTPSYTLSLSAGTAVYAAPGHDSGIARTLDKDGTFTIIQETRDTYGNPWGKLKSGAGWVALNIYPYTTPLYTDTAIHAGPGYQYSVNQILHENGTFTIVEEAWDADANLWGRLKSGAGWVFLKSENAMVYSPIHADYTGDMQFSSDTVHLYNGSETEYAVNISFFPGETLRNVAFSLLDVFSGDFAVSELLCTIDELTADKTFIASVEFPGDGTTYGLSFTASRGNLRRYTVSISGMDGSLELIEYK